jgi:hypothetical protein
MFAHVFTKCMDNFEIKQMLLILYYVVGNQNLINL